MKKILLASIFILLSGCATTVTTPESNNPRDTSSVLGGNGRIGAQNDSGVKVSQSTLTTLNFDQMLSGSEIDRQIVELSHDRLMPWMEQAQVTSGMVQRTIAMCTVFVSDTTTILQGEFSGLTLLNDLSGLTLTQSDKGFRVQLGSGYLNTKLIAKNTANQIINFSGALSSCESVPAYGYIRLNIVLNHPTQFALSINWSGNTVPVWATNTQAINFDYNSYNPNISTQIQSTPQNWTGILAVDTTLTSQDTGNIIISGYVVGDENTGNIKPLVKSNSGRLIDASGMTGIVTIKLYDRFGMTHTLFTHTYNGTFLTPSTDKNEYCPLQPYVGYFNRSGVEVIDVNKTNQELIRLYGTGKVTVYEGGCIGNVRVEHRLQSGESISGFTIFDIYGQKTRQKFPFMMSGKIDDSVRSLSIIGNGINVIVTQDWTNTIKVVSENIATNVLSFQSCSLKPQAIQTNQLKGYENLLQDYLFDCEKTKTLVTTKPQQYKYWTSFEQNVQIPSQVRKGSIIKVSSQTLTGAQSQYFVQSTAGLFTKQSDTRTYLWVYDLISGNPLTGGKVQIYSFGTGKWTTGSTLQIQGVKPVQINNSTLGVMNLVVFEDGIREGFVTIGPNSNATAYYTENGRIDLQSSISISDVSESLPTWGDSNAVRLYGYSDRGLYQPGDDLYVAGWIRNNQDVTNLSGLSKQGPVNISIRKADDWSVIPVQLSGVTVDGFGGFNAKLLLPSTMDMGDYYVQFDVAGAMYSQSIKVEEYQKPTYFTKIALRNDAGRMKGLIAPEYYFGGSLKKRDLDMDFAASSANNDVRRRWWNDADYYYDIVLSQGSSFSTGFSVSKKNLTTSGFVKELVKLSDLPAGTTTVKVQAKVHDLLSDEVQVQSEYQDFVNPYSLGLEGQTYEWYYDDTINKLDGIDGVVSGSKKPEKVIYTIYYFDWSSQGTYQGIDGSVYYNGRSYQAIKTGSLANSSFKVPTTIIKKPGSYLIQVTSFDKDGTEVARVEKEIYYAAGEGYNRGPMPNNFTLSVDIPKKEYANGDMIGINISPYIKGSNVLITVEQSNQILDTYQMVLDGSQVKIPAKRLYFPTSIVSVTQIVPQNIQAKEGIQPRFYQGYNKVMIDSSEFDLGIEIITDKKTYLPGDEATITIKTTDQNSKPVDARLSIGIVDKALNDLYSVYKNPLGDFFVSMGSSIVNYTNMKRIYQSLRVFTKPGSKGGGGGTKNILGALRESFEDVAYRRGGVYTKNGTYSFKTKLPDNLTTWTIDVVGISKDARVGTTKRDIVASKEFIIQPNLPGYMSVPDRLMVPVKAISLMSTNSSNKTVTYSGALISQSGVTITRFDASSDIDSSIALDIDTKGVNPFDSYVWVVLQAKRGNQTDGFKQKIQLRHNGLLGRISEYEQSKEGSIKLGVPAINSGSKLQASIGILPLSTINNLFQYAIGYPYGCTEQTLSKLSVLTQGKQYAEIGFLTGTFSGDVVTPEYGEPFSYKTAVADSINKIMKNQQANGGFSYWEGGNSDYSLSVYVYGALMDHQGWIKGFEQQFASLQRYLDENGGNKNQLQYLFYLHHKAKNQGGVNGALVKEIVQKNSSSLYANVLGASILSSIGDQQGSDKLISKISVNDFLQTNDNRELYPLLTTKSASQIYYNLLKLDKKYAKQSDQLVARLMSIRDDQGIWGRSTVDNLAMSKILYSYFKDAINQKDVTCTVKVGTLSKTINIKDYVGGTYTMQYNNPTSKDTLDRSCVSAVIVDTTTRFVYPNASAIPIIKNNVEYLDFTSSSSSGTIGGIEQLQGRFKVDQDARHVAIEFFIPSTYKPVELVSKKQDSLTYSGNRNCYPTHHEIRFDRIFLYYDKLDANTMCTITVPAIRAYEGTTQMMPSRIYQMYSGGPYAVQPSKLK